MRASRYRGRLAPSPGEAGAPPPDELRVGHIGLPREAQRVIPQVSRPDRPERGGRVAQGHDEDQGPQDGRQVFDGAQPHIGAVENYINVRFSQPGRLAGTQHTEKQFPGPDSPLTYARRNDPLLGEPRGLLVEEAVESVLHA